jgi:hypothetical protein
VEKSLRLLGRLPQVKYTLPEIISMTDGEIGTYLVGFQEEKIW